MNEPYITQCPGCGRGGLGVGGHLARCRFCGWWRWTRKVQHPSDYHTPKRDRWKWRCV